MDPLDPSDHIDHMDLMDPIDSLQIRFDAWKAANDPNQDDVGAVAITSPVSGGSLGAETLTISVQNFGIANQDTFEVGYSVNGGAGGDTLRRQASSKRDQHKN